MDVRYATDKTNTMTNHINTRNESALLNTIDII